MRIFSKSVLLVLIVFLALTATGIAGVYGLENVITSDEDLKVYTDTAFPIYAEVEKKGDGAVYGGTISYKAFNVFPLLSVDTTVFEDSSVYLGGIPLGISYQNGGLIVSDTTFVITEKGREYPALNSGIMSGDLITHADGKEVKNINDLENALAKCKGKDVTLTLKRHNSLLETTLTPSKDVLSDKYKLGLYLREGIDGLGTLTFVRADNHRFGALGHSITDMETGKLLEIADGNIYPAYIKGYRIGKEGSAGELKGMFNKQGKCYGAIDTNSKFGTFGTASDNLTANLKTIRLGSKKTIKNGKAYIYTTIDGIVPKKYEIEIIKLKKQATEDDKSLVFRVTDSELLAKTGGILQGMSGSPIVQNDRLVGAVTHVMLDESTTGYGLYIDWMIEK